MEAWRNKLPEDTKTHLEVQLKEVARLKEIYYGEKNAQNVQLWLGISNLSKSIFDINLKTKFLEKALKDLSELNKITSEKLTTITKIDIQKEINNTFTQISDINSRLKTLISLEKDSTSMKERLIELTEKVKPVDKLIQEIDDIKKVRVGILDRVKELETKASVSEKLINSQAKELERLKKTKNNIKAVKRKR